MKSNETSRKKSKSKSKPKNRSRSKSKEKEDKNRNLELAEYYWRGKDNFKGENPIIEIIVNGRIQVVEIIKENLELK